MGIQTKLLPTILHIIHFGLIQEIIYKNAKSYLKSLNYTVNNAGSAIKYVKSGFSIFDIKYDTITFTSNAVNDLNNIPENIPITLWTPRFNSSNYRNLLSRIYI